MKRLMATLFVTLVLMFGPILSNGATPCPATQGPGYWHNSPHVTTTNTNSGGDVIVRNLDEMSAELVDIVPFELPIYQQGKIGDITATMPEFKGLVKLGKKDVIVSIIAVYDGNWLSRIRLEDVEKEIIANVPKGEKIRYSVKFKDSVTTGGVGGGATGSLSSDPMSGAVLPGYHQSTHNPQFIITVYKVE